MENQYKFVVSKLRNGQTAFRYNAEETKAQRLVELFQFLVHNSDLMRLDTTPDILVEDSSIASQLKKKLIAAGFEVEGEVVAESTL
jgi:hypothetical protein